MFRHILVTLDGTPASEPALKQASALAKLTGATLTALSVIERLPAYAASLGEVEDVRVEAEAYFSRLHAAAVENARRAGVQLGTAIRAGEAAQAILHYCQEGNFDLLVIGAAGSHGLGGTADRVTDRAPCSVLIARSALLTLRVRDMMTCDVATVEPTTPLDEVMDLLLRRRVKGVPVVDGGQVVGMITGGDLLRRADMGLRLSLQRMLPAETLAQQKQQLAAQGKCAADIMTSPVIIVGRDDMVTDAARIMAEKRLKRLPVVDQAGGLVGIISRLDVLSTLASAVEGGETPPDLVPGMHRTAGDVMFKDVPTVSPDAPLTEVLNRILSTPLRRVAVLDAARRVLGVVSDADVLAHVSRRPALNIMQQLVARLARPSGEMVRLSGWATDVMQKDVYAVHAEKPLAAVVQTMIEKTVKRVVVVDEEGRLLGIVDREMILRVLANDKTLD